MRRDVGEEDPLDAAQATLAFVPAAPAADAPVPQPTGAPSPAPTVDRSACVDDPLWRKQNEETGESYNWADCDYIREEAEVDNSTWAPGVWPCAWPGGTWTNVPLGEARPWNVDGAVYEPDGRTSAAGCPAACNACPYQLLADPVPLEGLARGPAVVDELDLLLTAGRLSPRNREIIVEGYETELKASGSVDFALKAAQQLFAVTPEFHVSNRHREATEPDGTASLREPVAAAEGSGELGGYKAIVVLMLQGGADSFNMLVPHSGCADKDMFAEYEAVRGPAALAKSSLLQIDASSSDQVCDTFSVHPALPAVQELYADGDLLFVANQGPLVAPVSVEDVAAGSPWVPPGIYAHNIQQTAATTLFPQKPALGKGVLGRLADALEALGAGAGKYSISGTARVLEAEVSPIPPQVLSPGAGLVPFDSSGTSSALDGAFKNLTGAVSRSVFAETWSSNFRASLSSSKLLEAALDAVELETAFPATETAGTGGGLGKQFAQIATIIAANNRSIGNDRDVFFAQQGGFDTHFDLGLEGTSALAEMFGYVSDSLASFAAEMKAQGRWDEVLVVQVSDFGRTLTSNGVGT